MRKTVISFGLSEREIGDAVKELERYKRDLVEKTELLRTKVAERIADLSNSGFARAVIDDLLNGSKKIADVEVYVEVRDNISVVIADGEDAVWAEFGAGVYHNGSAGSSPHPSGAELGFTIGGYGKGMGKRKVWGYYEGGELNLTHGAPATMPLYNAMKIVCAELSIIAGEVFR